MTTVKFASQLMLHVSLLAGPCSSLFIGPMAEAQLCQNWSDPVRIGSLDHATLAEASGIATSSHYQGRLYHINDSGNAPVLYTTGMDGRLDQAIQLEDFDPTDTEDLALGPCGPSADSGSVSCIYIADTGDNHEEREEVSVTWLQERSRFSSSEKLTGRARLRYPDGPHNTEAMVVHPSGDLFLFTKSMAGKYDEATMSRVYRLPAAELHAASKDLRGAMHTLKYVGRIDIPEMLDGKKTKNQAVTSADVSSDGQRLLLLTYKNVIEMRWDFASPLKPLSRLEPGVDYTVMKLKKIPQQEAIAYLPGSRSFIVSSESEDGSEDAPLVRIDCRD